MMLAATIDDSVRQPILTPAGLVAFRLAVLSLALPFFDLPVIAVSVSAPLFAFVLIEVIGSGALAQPRYFNLLTLAALFASAQIVSVVVRVLAGNSAGVGAEGTLLLARYVYWACIFSATAMVVYRHKLGKQTVNMAAIGLIALAAIRLTEAIFFGAWGSGNPQWLTQNDYGFLFSMFSPFVLWYIVQSRGSEKIFATLGGLLVVAAIIGNGSRSSWIASSVGIAVILAVFFMRGKAATALGAFAVFVVAISAASAIAPPSWRDPVVARIESFANLQTDKPYLTRQVLIAKGVSLFLQHPITGVGAGRFEKEWADLDLPPALRYQPQDFYNRRTPHNAYIKLLAEGGLVGFVPLIALLAWVFWGSLNRSFSARSTGWSWVPAVFASLCSTSIHLWTVSGLTGSAPWFVFGLGGAAALSGTRMAMLVFKPILSRPAQA
jgi:O-antigen ligase